MSTTEPRRSVSKHRGEAIAYDVQDPLARLRDEFIIPTKADLKAKTLRNPLEKTSELDTGVKDQDLCIYLCGNSLGLQPRRTRQRIDEHLAAWATKGVYGHFFKHDGEAPPPFLDADDAAAKKMAPIVGADPAEVAVMETLTANLHLLMASFYRPTEKKYKIILEGKAFPSDQYAVQSQIKHHGLSLEKAMVSIDPISPAATISTEQILATIDEHADTTALILLPGIQYFSGQLLDIPTITAHAHSHGIIIGWDLAHAVGNVGLKLHEWDVDFAAWCTYKYLNSGPGAIAGLFVHEKHGKVEGDPKSPEELEYRPRLSGWWGGRKSLRFDMAQLFVPTPGAAGFQVGNTSALALASVAASLEIFEMTNMQAIREKSVKITGFLEELLEMSKKKNRRPYRIITPTNPEERGAQLSLKLDNGILDAVMEGLEEEGVVLDERKPDVIRIAPAPLYNTYDEVYNFVEILDRILDKIQAS